MTKCTIESSDDDSVTTHDSYADAARELMRLYDNYRWIGYVVTPIVNGKFTYYLDGEDDEQGTTIEIVKEDENEIL